MRGQKIDALEKRLDPRPQTAKVFGHGHIAPLEPMNIGKNKFLRGGPNEVNHFLSNHPGLHLDQADGTGAVFLIICSFKIYGQKIH